MTISGWIAFTLFAILILCAGISSKTIFQNGVL